MEVLEINKFFKHSTKGLNNGNKNRHKHTYKDYSQDFYKMSSTKNCNQKKLMHVLLNFSNSMTVTLIQMLRTLFLSIQVLFLITMSRLNNILRSLATADLQRQPKIKKKLYKTKLLEVGSYLA